MGDPAFPMISVIVPNYNQADRLHQCLTALENQTYAKSAYEVLVIDNDSSDGSADIAKAFDVRLFNQSTAPNPYISRNMGLDNAQFEMLAFLDSKCVPGIGWLEAGVRALQEQELDIVAGHFLIETAKPPSMAERAFAVMYLDNAHSVLEKNGTVPSGNFFARRAAFARIGPFNEKSRSGGDNEWTHRARRAGLKIGYSDQAIASYPAKAAAEFYPAIVRFGKGARAQWLPSKGRFRTMAMALSYLFPMSPWHFQSRLRTMSHSMGGNQKLLLWLTVWRARTIFAWAMLGL